MTQFDYNTFKHTSLPPAWPKGLLSFIFIIFLLTLAVFFGLDYYNKLQNKNLEVLNSQFQKLRESFSVSDEEKIALFEKKITNLEKLLKNHIYFSNILAFLERVTHPQVYYTSLDYSADKNSLILEGVAKNQQILSEAINGFANDSQDIKMVILRDMKVNNDNTVEFHVELLLQPQLLKYQPLTQANL